jgi:two-component system, chemotaxis family, chemotaxis protein CheY
MAVDLSMPVLVVDDYSTMIRIIRNLLKQLGFENIDDASDGSAALNKMRSKKYGLVISDWNMEPMTGYDLLREVRADPNLATTPFIMITAESKTENVIAAKKAGVNNYIVKPFNAATLKTKIEAVFPDMASTEVSRRRDISNHSSCPGLTRASIACASRHRGSFQKMDCRVKPGNDEIGLNGGLHYHHFSSRVSARGG